VDGKAVGPVVRLTFGGSAVLVALSLALYLAASTRPIPVPPLRTAA